MPKILHILIWINFTQTKQLQVVIKKITQMHPERWLSKPEILKNNVQRQLLENFFVIKDAKWTITKN